jgi:hypothetical protein
MKAKACERLRKAAADGRLQASLAAVKEQKVSTLRSNAWQKLTAASADGRLTTSLMKVTACERLRKAAADGRLQASLAAVKEQKVSTLRSNAWQKLTAATADGRLSTSLMRVTAFERLRKAAADGRLQASLTAVKEQKVSTLRSDAWQKLTAAATDGRLSTSLMKVKACERLRKAAADGRLQASLAAVKEQKVEIFHYYPAVQDVIAQVFMQASTRICKENAATMLASAAVDGRLMAALARAKASQQQPNAADEVLVSSVAVPLTDAGEEVAEAIEVFDEEIAETIEAVPLSSRTDKSTEDEIQEELVSGTNSQEPERCQVESYTMVLAAGAPARALKRHGKQVLRSENLTVFRMHSPSPGDSKMARESSLARGYEALGVELHSMDDSRVRSRAPAVSAMEQDLGPQKAKSSSLLRSSSQGALQMQKVSVAPSMARSTSTGGLQTLAPLASTSTRKKLRAIQGLGQGRKQPVAFAMPRVAAGSGLNALRYTKFCQ